MYISRVWRDGTAAEMRRKTDRHVSIFRTIMWTIRCLRDGHFLNISPSFGLFSKPVSREYQSPGPMLSVCKHGHDASSSFMSGIMSGTSGKTPSHLPSSPSSMHGTSRKTFPSSGLFLMSLVSVQK